MSNDINKIINEFENASPEEISQRAGLNIKSVMSAAGSLSSKGIIIVEKEVDEKFSLTKDGKKIAEKGLPERRVLKKLQERREMAMKELSQLDELDSPSSMNLIRRSQTSL